MIGGPGGGGGRAGGAGAANPHYGASAVPVPVAVARCLATLGSRIYGVYEQIYSIS